MSSYQQIQRAGDTHERCRTSILRFAILDYTIHSSLKSLARRVDKEQIKCNLENPYSIDIDQYAINVALDRLKFSRIHWNNLFSNKPIVIDSENEKLQEFLAYYFDLERHFLENAHPIPDIITTDPHHMKKITISDEDNSLSIIMQGITDNNPNPKLIIKKGQPKEEYDLIVEKVMDVHSNEANYYVYLNESEKRRSKIAMAYLNYRTDLFLQSILSFFIRYPDKIDELLSPSSIDDSINAEFDLTTKIENVTSNAPSYDIVKLLLKIFTAMSLPLTSEDEERNLIMNELMPQNQISELYSDKEELKALPLIEDITEYAGLTTIRSELSDLLSVDLAEGIDIFDDIIGICSSLFNGSLSEDMRFLDSQLPTVISRFQTSQATPFQQDHFFRALDVVTDILKNAITKERMSDLHTLSTNLRSTSITTHFFRSLNDLAKSFNDLAKSNSKPQSRFSLNQLWERSSWYDLYKSNRLDFLFVIWWMLTADNKLYKIYEYCRNRSFGKLDKETGLISAAIFPGSLVEPQNGLVSISTIYQTQKIKNKEISQMLMKPGAIASLIGDYTGRAL